MKSHLCVATPSPFLHQNLDFSKVKEQLDKGKGVDLVLEFDDEGANLRYFGNKYVYLARKFV